MGGGKIVALLTQDSLPVVALFKASHVLVGVPA